LTSASTHNVELDGDVDVDSLVDLDLDHSLVMFDHGSVKCHEVCVQPRRVAVQIDVRDNVNINIDDRDALMPLIG
jgi:hypothetical protein